MTDLIVTEGATFKVFADDGVTVKYVQQRPECGLANRLAVQLSKLEDVLGLNAQGRGKIDLKRPQAPARSEYMRRYFGDSATLPMTGTKPA
jgi:hypothetical protein